MSDNEGNDHVVPGSPRSPLDWAVTTMNLEGNHRQEWAGHPAVEYFDPEDGQYHWCYAANQPAHDGYSYPDNVVYMLEAERDTVRHTRDEYEADNDKLQEEIKKLLGQVEQLQVQVAELQTDRVHIGQRYKKVYADAKAMKAQLANKAAYANQGMKLLGKAYDAFEKVLVSTAVPSPPETTPSVNDMHRVAVMFEEAVGSGVGSGVGPEEVIKQEVKEEVAGPSRRSAGPMNRPPPFWVLESSWTNK